MSQSEYMSIVDNMISDIINSMINYGANIDPVLIAKLQDELTKSVTSKATGYTRFVYLNSPFVHLVKILTRHKIYLVSSFLPLANFRISLFGLFLVFSSISLNISFRIELLTLP